MIVKMMFSEAATSFVLEVLNKKIDGAGYIADITTGEIVEDESGTQLTEDNFGGIYNGGFITLDLLSIINLVD